MIKEIIFIIVLLTLIDFAFTGLFSNKLRKPQKIGVGICIGILVIMLIKFTLSLI